MRALLFLKNECRQSFKILCSLACILALALSIATAIGQTERMIKSSSSKAAEQFDILVGAKGSRTSLLLSTVYLRDEMISLTPASALNVLSEVVCALGFRRPSGRLTASGHHACVCDIGRRASAS